MLIKDNTSGQPKPSSTSADATANSGAHFSSSSSISGASSNASSSSSSSNSNGANNQAAASNGVQLTNHSQVPSCDAPTTTTPTQSDRSITILHFNDCYNVEPGPESSGAAGFLTAINQHRNSDPLILFSGDIISPSFMSTFTKGQQMIPVLNSIGVHCAVFGNHEFDYGVDNLIEFTKQTSFPWLLSNVIDKETSNQLGDGQVFHIIERAGLKFGLIGLIEEEWLSTLSTLDSSDVIYRDFVEVGRELARSLKEGPSKVDYVIALTHCRTPNDIRLADSVPEIDLILGGHDHDYEVIKRPNCYIVKSGTDFREFSKITLSVANKFCDKQRASSAESPLKIGLDIQRIDCSSFPPDERLKNELEKFVTTIDEKMGQVLGQFNCDLDGRFSSIRKFETNLGNFVTDIMLASTHADLAILNSGTLRSDRIHPKGDFTMRDLFNILGYIDPIAVLQASGRQIWQALENGVSAWPKLEGRFPQISGCSFVFDPDQKPMSRIRPEDITIGDEPLELERTYKLTTKAYLASGKDGYDILRECTVLVPGDESPDLTTSILNHFEAINIVKSNRRTHHRQSIICLSRSSLKKILDQTTQRQQTESTMAPNNALQQQFASMTNNDCCHHHHNDNNNNISDNEGDTNALEADRVSNATSLAGDAVQSPESSLGNSVHQPAASSPLVGMVAPTPTLHSMSSFDGDLSRSQSLASAITPLAASQRQPRVKRLMSVYEMEHEQCKMEPKVEGRIKILGVNA